jgi:hypothetical protein
VTAVAAVPDGWQSLTGILANDPEQAVYLVNFTDDHGATSQAIVAMSSSPSRCINRAKRTTRRGRSTVADEREPQSPGFGVRSMLGA